MKKIFIFIIIIIAITLIFILGNKFNNNRIYKDNTKINSKFQNVKDINNIKLYKKNVEINSEYQEIELAKEQKNTLKEYIKKEEFIEEKEEIICSDVLPNYKYLLKFNNYQISFDDNWCYYYLYDVNNNSKVMVRLSSKLEDYFHEIIK